MSNLNSNQIERHFLGGLIQNQNAFAEVEGFLNERDFCAKPHDVIYSCIKSSLLNKEKLDKVLLAQKIKNLGISFKDDINIFDYIDAICFTPITYDATIGYAKELKKLSILRGMHETCTSIQNHISKSVNAPLDQTIGEVDKIYGEVIDVYDTEEKPVNLFETMYEDIEEKGNDPKPVGLDTPYPTFNHFYGPFRDGNVYAVASRSGEGKSTWLNYTSVKMSEIHNIPVLQLDTELQTDEVKFRTAAALSKIPHWLLEGGDWRKSKEHLETVRGEIKNYKNKYKVYHYYVGNKSIESIISIVRRWHASVVPQGGKCLVCYDYLKVSGEKLGANFAEYQVIGHKVDCLKRLCTELKFPLLTAIQINRAGENKGRNSNDVTDDASIISLSDRLLWFCSYLGIFRRKTFNEIAEDGIESGTHKIVELKSRWNGKGGSGHNDFIQRTYPNGEKKWIRNYLNYNVTNFAITDLGSLKDSIARQNAQFLLSDPHNHTDNSQKPL